MRSLPLLVIGRAASWRARVERVFAAQADVHWLGAFAPGEPRPLNEVNARLVLVDADDPRARPRCRRPASDPLRHVDFYRRVDPHCVLRSLGSHANGCLSKAAATDSIMSAIELVQSGLFVTEPLHGHDGAAGDIADAAGGVAGSLTSRQLDVIRLAAMGLTNKQIARALGVSPETVKSHLHRAFHDWRVGGRVALIAAVVGSVDWQQRY